MRFAALLVLLLLTALLAAGCGSESGIPESSLTLRNATTNALISTSRTTGAITLETAEEYPVLVIRTYKDETGQTFNEDVTQFANFEWIYGDNPAHVDAFGNITGLTDGDSTLEVKFRESSLDPWDIVYLDVSVFEPED